MRCVRRDCSQALLLDVALAFPGLAESLVGVPRSGMALQLYVIFTNLVWVYVFCAFFYSIFNCVRGKAVGLPLLGESVEAQIRM